MKFIHFERLFKLLIIFEFIYKTWSINLNIDFAPNLTPRTLSNYLGFVQTWQKISSCQSTGQIVETRFWTNLYPTIGRLLSLTLKFSHPVRLYGTIVFREAQKRRCEKEKSNKT